MKILRIAIDVPVNTLFDYRGDDAYADDIGRLVLVPFGRKTTVGVIVEIVEQSGVPPARLKTALRVLRDTPALSGDDLDLLKFTAAYYHHAVGATIMSALPTLLRRVDAPRPATARAGATPRAGPAQGTGRPGSHNDPEYCAERDRRGQAVHRQRLGEPDPSSGAVGARAGRPRYYPGSAAHERAIGGGAGNSTPPRPVHTFRPAGRDRQWQD
jgi:primosomal protein N'